MPTRPRPWLRGALLGLLGSALIAPLPFAVGYLPDGTRGFCERNLPWLRHAFGRYLTRSLALVGSLLLFWAWLRLRPRAGEHRSVPWRRIALLWTLPLWPVPPVMTADPFAYAAQGWLLHRGMNPYEVAMGYPGPFSDGVYDAWQHTTAVYPPLALHLQRLVVEATGAHAYWSVVAMRVLALAGVALMVAVTPLLARQLGLDRDRALWAVALNPLSVVQMIGGAHNDALMVGLVMLALWLAGRRYGLLLGCAAIGVAAAVKQPAILAGAGVALYAATAARHRTTPDADGHPLPLQTVLSHLGLGAAIGGAVFALLSLPGRLLLGWMGEYAGSPSLVINHSPLSWLAQLALRWHVRLSIVDATLTAVSGVLMLAAVVWLVRRFGTGRPLRLTAGVLLVFGLLGPAIQPWYVLWGGPLLVFCRPRPWLARLAVATVGLLLVSGVLQEFWSPVITVPLSALAAFAWYRLDARRERASEVGDVLV